MGFLKDASDAIAKSAGSAKPSASGSGSGGGGFFGGAIARALAEKKASSPTSVGDGALARAVMSARNTSMPGGKKKQVKRMSEGGSVSSGRGDGIAVRGKTKCKMY